MKGFQGLVSGLSRFMGVIAGVTLVFVMLLTVLDVILRYFGYPIMGVYDLVALGGAVIIGFSLPYASDKRVHVFMEMVQPLFGKTGRQALDVLTRLIAFGISLLIGWNLVKLGTGFRQTGEASLTIQIVFYPIAIGLGICFFLQTLVFASQIVQGFSGEAMSEITVGLLGLALLLVLFVTGLELALAMLVVGFLGFAYVISPAAASNLLAKDIFETFESYSLTVVPLFILMGQLAFNGGIAGRLYDTAHRFLGHIRGGLAVATVCGCTVFGAICGSAAATAATFASVSIPEMDRFGYSRRFSAGLVAIAGTLGIMIPPSVPLIIYGIITQQSIGKLFVAGIIPGVVICLLFIVLILARCKINPSIAPKVSGSRGEPGSDRFQGSSGRSSSSSSSWRVCCTGSSRPRKPGAWHVRDTCALADQKRPEHERIREIRGRESAHRHHGAFSACRLDRAGTFSRGY